MAGKCSDTARSTCSAFFRKSPRHEDVGGTGLRHFFGDHGVRNRVVEFLDLARRDQVKLAHKRLELVAQRGIGSAQVIVQDLSLLFGAALGRFKLESSLEVRGKLGVGLGPWLPEADRRLTAIIRVVKLVWRPTLS